MGTDDVPGQAIPVDASVPDTDRFQVLFAPDGRCRVTVYDDVDGVVRALATLTLSAEAADELGRTLTERRAAYDKARHEQQGGRTQ